MLYSIVRGLAVVALSCAVTASLQSPAAAQGEDLNESSVVKDLDTVPEYEPHKTRGDSYDGPSRDDVLEHRLGGCPEGPPCPSPSSSIAQPSSPSEPESCGGDTPCPKDE